jgi:CIC family chloride channel protein
LMRNEKNLILDSLLLGVVGALSAQVFTFLLNICQDFFLNWMAGYTPPGLPNEGGRLVQVIGSHGLYLIPLVTALGGLISGFLVYTFAPEAEGHGTDSVVKAFHRAGGYIRPRVAPIKMLASAITIGSGGSAGREGPIAQITAAVGSIYATLSHRSDEERRLIVLIGMAAGLSAIFRSPIGTAFFAVEVLYGRMEFEGRALLYTMLASIVAYAINSLFVGWEPLFRVPADIGVTSIFGYFWYVVLGLASGLIATILPFVFYSVRDLFRSIAIPPHIKPAIGGLLVGLIAMALPQVLSGGYGWIQEAINGGLTAKLFLALLFAKIIAFSLTVSSGGSGGVFAPSLFVGAMLGGFIAQLFNLPQAGLVIVGMAAVFGGAARVPIATLLMVTEMTGGYQLLVPAALAVMLSYLIQVKLSSGLKYKSLYEAQVPGPDDSPAHYVGEVQSALRLLDEHRVSAPTEIGHLELQSLLQSGVVVDLSDGRQLTIAALKPESPCAGKPIKAGCLYEPVDTLEIVAIIRGKEILLPHPEIVLRAGDRILFITAPHERERLSQHLSDISEEKS